MSTKHTNSLRPLDPFGESQPVFRTSNATLAEYVRIVLTLEEVRVAVLAGDPVKLGHALFEVVILAEEHQKAKAALEAAKLTSHTEDWNCPACEEPVPRTFDYCWNCGLLHPELVDELESRFVAGNQEDSAVPETNIYGREEIQKTNVVVE